MKIKKVICLIALVAFTLTSCDKNEANQISNNKNIDETFLKFDSNSDFLDYLKTFQTTNDTANFGLVKAKRIYSKVKVPENFKSINQICLNEVQAKLKKIGQNCSFDDDEIEEMTLILWSQKIYCKMRFFVM